MKNASPAQILQQLLEEKWKLKESDKKISSLQHLFGYTLNSKIMHISPCSEGENSVYTGNGKNSWFTWLWLQPDVFWKGEIKLNGIQVPVLQEIYQPALRGIVEIRHCFQVSRRRSWFEVHVIFTREMNVINKELSSSWIISSSVLNRNENQTPSMSLFSGFDAFVFTRTMWWQNNLACVPDPWIPFPSL